MPAVESCWIGPLFKHQGTSDQFYNISGLQAGLQAQGYNGQMAVTMHNARDTKQLMDAGADQVLIPYTEASENAINKLYGETKESNE